MSHPGNILESGEMNEGGEVKLEVESFDTQGREYICTGCKGGENAFRL
jgi:hypothetical protein